MWNNISNLCEVACGILLPFMITGDLHVKAHVKPHVKYMWKYVWISSMWNSRSFAIQWGLNACESPCETPFEVYVKICVNLHVSSILHTFHIYFTMQNFTCMWNMCVKFMWKGCEKCVKRVWKLDNFHTFFHMMFYIHTPSSVLNQSNFSAIKFFCVLLFCNKSYLSIKFLRCLQWRTCVDMFVKRQ